MCKLTNKNNGNKENKKLLFVIFLFNCIDDKLNLQ